MGEPEVLFEGEFMALTGARPYYDVTPDGQGFLMVRSVQTRGDWDLQVNVVTHWLEELNARVPIDR